MTSLGRRTTLADERRALRLQSQQLTAPPRVHNDTYDSSSDEEDPEPYQPEQATEAPAAPSNNNTEQQDKAALEAEYAQAVQKRPRRTRPTLKASVLTDPATGLARLLHQQPKLLSLKPPHQKPTVTACAAYTRQLFAHYHGAVRVWTDNGVDPTTTNVWMHQVEKLSSQKELREHLQSLRQVMCRRFVESKVGLEKAERYWEQLAMDAQGDAQEEEAAPADDNEYTPDNHSTDPPRSPTRSTATAATTAVSPTQDDPARRPKRRQSHVIATTGTVEPAAKRPATDDSDEEVEFETQQRMVVSKRRVLDDSDDEEDAVMESASDTANPTNKKPDEPMATEASIDEKDPNNGEATAEPVLEKSVAEEKGTTKKDDTTSVSMGSPTKASQETDNSSPRLQVVAEMTQPTSPQTGMVLGQQTPASPSLSPDSELLPSPEDVPLVPTQLASQEYDADEIETQPPAAAAKHNEDAATQETDAPEDEETLIPSFPETQDTLIPTMTENTQ